MSFDTSYLDRPPRLARVADRSEPDVVDLLDGMVSSAEPAVVFSSAVQLCTPQICASVVAAVSEAGERTYLVAGPRGRSSPVWSSSPDASCMQVAFGGVEVSPHSAVIEIRGPASTVHCAYEGVLVMTFDRAGPTNRLLGQLVVDRAVALVTVERLHDIAEMHRMESVNLQAALRSSRDIGVALGIVMNRYRLTQEMAFDLLRVSSQNSHRKVRDLAAEIAFTGSFDVPDPALARCAGLPS